MKIDLKNLVSITEANQNFSKIAERLMRRVR
jgi:Holliday junction resolvasome RuvABC ATP-dependent DNA helicase subunit